MAYREIGPRKNLPALRVNPPPPKQIEMNIFERYSWGTGNKIPKSWLTKVQSELCVSSAPFYGSLVILDGNSNIDAQESINLCYLICARHLIRSYVVSNVVFLFRKDIFSLMHAQHALSYHPIWVPWLRSHSLDNWNFPCNGFAGNQRSNLFKMKPEQGSCTFGWFHGSNRALMNSPIGDHCFWRVMAMRQRNKTGLELKYNLSID